MTSHSRDIMNTRTEVYTVIRAYIETNRYSPSLQDVADRIGYTVAPVRAAVIWLTERRFLSYTPRKVRTIRLVPRFCHCGEEITPVNAVYGVKNGRQFVRGSCNQCWGLVRSEIQKRYRAKNLDYYRRMWKVWARQNRRTAS